MNPLLICCCLFASPLQAQQKPVRIGPDTRHLIPAGKEVDAIDRDGLLRNRHVTAVIANPDASRKANMTVKNVAGALIDLAVNSGSSDQLSAFYPGRRAHRLSQRSMDSRVLRTDDGEFQVSAIEVSTSDRSVVVEYALTPDSHGVRIQTTFTNKTDKPQTIKLEDDIRADSGKESMGKNPNGDVDIVWIEDRFWGQAYGVFSEHGKIRSNTNSRDSVLKYLIDGNSTRKLKPGEQFQLTRWIFVGKDLMRVRAKIAAHRGQTDDLIMMKITMKDGLGQPLNGALVQFKQEGKVLGHTKDLGRVVLPKGTYEIQPTVNGQKLRSGELVVRATNGTRILGEANFKYADYKPGTVTAAITAEDGSPIPCKVELIPHEGTPKPNFGPETAEFGVKNVIYSPNGTFEQTLASGKYDVIISRGPEYDAIFTELEVPAGKTATLAGKLVRTVKTPGWISCDYHSHSSPSGDNTGSQLGRVLNLAAEHIEFAPCTEHNRVSTYDGHIASQKLGQFMRTVSGMELTGGPLPLNHQNVFPMVHRPYQQDGGGPQTDNSPEKQMERLAAWDDKSRKLIQQNHPDIGWLFFDKNGDGKPDAGYERSFQHMDVMEIHGFEPTGPLTNIMELGPYNINAKGKAYRNNCIFNWLQLLNQGYRVMGIVNTDAHYNFHGSGWLRNWVKSATDNPADIDLEEMLINSEAGMLVMSNGPYLEATLTEQNGTKSAVSGQDLNASSGQLQAHVRVQCANWLDIDRVFILVNGKASDKLTFTREKNPEMFSDDVLKFDRKINIQLKDDAHVIVCTGHKTQTLGPVMGPTASKHKIAAFTNPMFVNVKGEDFVPNKDTLGHPLPVKKQK